MNDNGQRGAISKFSRDELTWRGHRHNNPDFRLWKFSLDLEKLNVAI